MSVIPASRHAPNTVATFWNAPSASPRTITPKPEYSCLTAFNRAVNSSSVTKSRSSEMRPSWYTLITRFSGAGANAQVSLTCGTYSTACSPFRELGSHHEEDNEQEHDVDHRCQVQRRLFVLVCFERHNASLSGMTRSVAGEHRPTMVRQHDRPRQHPRVPRIRSAPPSGCLASPFAVRLRPPRKSNRPPAGLRSQL